MIQEVPGYWQNGMNVSDDITLLWSDDNRGNIRRIPIANETTRRGGSGIYYHFDYVGDPRNYKWINTIQLQNVGADEPSLSSRNSEHMDCEHR